MMYVIKNNNQYKNVLEKTWYKDINKATAFPFKCDAEKYTRYGDEIIEVTVDIKIVELFHVVYHGVYYLKDNGDWTHDKVKAGKFCWLDAQAKADELSKKYQVIVFVYEVDN
jgi:hypothetical protein